MAKAMKRQPPTVATVRCEIFKANSRPPTTARDVQTVCPIVAPSVTPHGFLCAASAMVAIWLRSPHSAKKVRMKDSRKIGVQKRAKSRRTNVFF